MPSRLSRLLALLIPADRRRLAASVLAPLFLAFSFGCGYIAALSVGEFDAVTPDEQPLVATIDSGPAALTAPQATEVSIVGARAVDPKLRPVCPTRDRAPPSLVS